MKSKFARYLLFLLSVVVLSGLSFFFYQKGYSIEPDWSNLESAVQEAYLKDSATPIPVHLYDHVQLGDEALVLVELDQEQYLGVATLKQSLTGRWKVKGLTYSEDQNFYEAILKVGGARYVLFGGRNPEQRIAAVTFNLYSVDYKLEIPAQDRFFVSRKLNIRNKDQHIPLDTLHFLDAAGNDITSEIAWNN